MDTLTFARIGALLNSALYLVGVLVAGLVLGHTAAVFLALASAGCAYLNYAIGALIVEDGELGLDAPELAHGIALWLLILSILLGLSAALALLV